MLLKRLLYPMLFKNPTIWDYGLHTIIAVYKEISEFFFINTLEELKNTMELRLWVHLNLA